MLTFPLIYIAAECKFDIRISPNMQPSEVTDRLSAWCEECTLPGGKVSWDYIFDTTLQEHSITSTDPNINPWWGLFRTFLEEECTMKVVPSVFPAASDSRFLRALGMRAVGFSPIRGCPILLHEHDEYIPVDIFHEGCDVYVHLMMALSIQGLFEGDNSYYREKKIVTRPTPVPPTAIVAPDETLPPDSSSSSSRAEEFGVSV